MYSTCCDAQFFEPGYPENDICSACGEHTDAWTDDKDECKHPEKAHEWQDEEKDNNVPERYYCRHCDSDLDMPEPDWMSKAKGGYKGC